ncbi:putative bifunctional diguanylate cyclase/phosphodiesterase [Ferrimonas balearica]|uniref:putative bifunctional diguanylate cyclase/phosphodiesterase n=1 Tax=Ferrimonas balearica TaxID=44012 RepID=UPI001C999513|nr:EAL domain-containing protein [Ferrimonas balearica]MBY5992658.1 EAL domain-containing protein [Ferrimonas balearica]
MLWKSWPPIRTRILLVQLLLVLAGSALSWQVYHSGQVVNANAESLVNRRLPELVDIRSLSEEQLRTERLLYEYYADQNRDHYLVSYLEVQYRFEQALTNLRLRLPDNPLLEQINQQHEQSTLLAQQLDSTLSQRPVDWDRTRSLLNQISELRRESQPQIKQLQRDLNLQAQEALAQTLDSTQANTRWVIGFALLIVIGAFIASVMATRLLTDRAERRRLAAFAERNPDPILSVNPHGQLLYLNPAAIRLAKEQQLPLSPRELIPDLSHQLHRMEAQGKTDHDWEFALGRRYMTARAVMLSDLQQIQVHLRDITSASRAEAELRHRATHDLLTDLPNRHQFEQDCQQLMEEDPNGGLILGLLNLTRFHRVTAQVGFQAGDSIICATARRLTRALNPLSSPKHPIALYRFGGTRFALLVQGKDSSESLALIAQAIKEGFSEPVYSEGALASFVLAFEQGYAHYPQHADSPQELLRCADAAVREDGQQPNTLFTLFDPRMRDLEEALISLENELRIAMQEKQFRLFYQPKQCLKDDSLTGAEALIRWQHPHRGLLRPSDFISLAEQTGLIVDIGEWVLEQACIQAKSWHEQGLELTVSLNLSPRQFQQPDFVKRVAEILKETQAPASRIELELTESLLMEDLDAAYEMLCQLKQLGLQLAIDDFGTGYSSLAYLKRFPVDTLKIDRSFIANLPADTQDSAIIRSILDLAQHLNLKVVAEGVETQGQHDWLQQAGCDVIQGFWYSRPLAYEDWVKMLDHYRRNVPMEGDPTRCLTKG